jgi:uncharacterized protein YggT (Ycf19 family)
MRLIDFILNLAGLLLWLNWRAAKADPISKSRPATLIGTLRRAEPGAMKGWHLALALGALLLLRALFYWQIGSAAGWMGKLDLEVTTVFFHSNVLGRMLLFSIFSFARMFGIFYLCLVLLSAIKGPMPIHRLVRMQLGKIDDWPHWMKLPLPLVVIAFGWGLASWPFAWLHPKPMMSVTNRIEEALVIGSGSYLVWKFLIAAFLVLHLLNSYIYFGRHPLWNYVNVLAKRLLRPLESIPLRAGKVDFAPVVGIALVFLLAELAERALTYLYGHLSS